MTRHSHICALIDQSPMNRGMDGAAWLSDPRNIVQVTPSGNVMMFGWAPGSFEFHWLQTNTKGRKAIDETKQSFADVFAATGCAFIYGLVPVDRRDSALMARWIGAKSVAIVETPHGKCEMFIVVNREF